MKKPPLPREQVHGFKSNFGKALLFVFLVFNLLDTGCSSTAKKSRIAADSAVAVSVTTEDALSNVIEQGSLKVAAKRIYNETIIAMEGRGIKGSSEQSAGQPKLTVEVTTIETFNKREVRIVFLATLVASDGTKLFRVNGRKANESLDEATKTVGRYLAKQVAKHHD